MRQFYEKMQKQIKQLCTVDQNQTDPQLKSEIVLSLIEMQKNQFSANSCQPFTLYLKPHTKHVKSFLKQKSNNNINPLLKL